MAAGFLWSLHGGMKSLHTWTLLFLISVTFLISMTIKAPLICPTGDHSGFAFFLTLLRKQLGKVIPFHSHWSPYSGSTTYIHSWRTRWRCRESNYQCLGFSSVPLRKTGHLLFSVPCLILIFSWKNTFLKLLPILFLKGTKERIPAPTCCSQHSI